MRYVQCFCVLMLIAMTLTGCGPVPPSPEGAREAALSFLTARQEGNASAVYGALVEAGREALTTSRVAHYLEDEVITFGDVGQALDSGHGWMRVRVTNMVRRIGGDEVLYPEVYLSLTYQEDAWRVGWADPLLADAVAAYDQGDYAVQQDLAQVIIAVDPFHYRGYLEQHFAYRGLKRPREAEYAINQAFDHAVSWQVADVHDAMARFQLMLGQGVSAVEHATAALATANPYTPRTYSDRWQADTAVVAARAYRLTGDSNQMATMLQKAAELDPYNAHLALLRHELAQSRP